MTERLELAFLSEESEGRTPNPLLEEVSEKGAEVVLALFRLIKNALVHALDNQAMRTTAAQSQAVLSQFASMMGGSCSVTFVEDTVFVCGQIVRASRPVYESAIALGKLLDQCGVSEIRVESGVGPDDLVQLAGLVVQTVRDPSHRGGPGEVPIPHVVCRRVDALLRRQDRPSALPVPERALEMYASSLVAMRRFFDGVASGATLLPQRVKRIAQCFVSLAETRDLALLGLLPLVAVHRDDAARSLHTAMLAIVTARQFTTDRNALVRLAMMALVADTGRVQLGGREGRDQLVPLSERALAVLPARSAGACIAMGGVNAGAARRSVVAFETNWIEHAELLGPLYDGGRRPLPETQILLCVRAFVDAIAPRDTSAPLTPPEALRRVAEHPQADSLVARALVQAVGILPVGTVVELETGAWAVVVAPPRQHPPRGARVRVVVEADGRPGSGTDLEVGAKAGLADIARVIPPDRVPASLSCAILGVDPTRSGELA